MKRTGLTLILVVIILVLALGGGYAYYRKNGGSLTGVIKDSGSNISDYSAVFLTNGQVYFGKIKSEDSTEVDLTDIYYLQVNQQIQPTQSGTATPAPSSAANVVLVKLGQELHGPNDQMHINRSQVLFTESLKSDSKVIDAIKNYQTSK